MSKHSLQRVTKDLYREANESSATCNSIIYIRDNCVASNASTARSNVSTVICLPSPPISPPNVFRNSVISIFWSISFVVSQRVPDTTSGQGSRPSSCAMRLSTSMSFISSIGNFGRAFSLAMRSSFIRRSSSLASSLFRFCNSRSKRCASFLTSRSIACSVRRSIAMPMSERIRSTCMDSFAAFSSFCAAIRFVASSLFINCFSSGAIFFDLRFKSFFFFEIQFSFASFNRSVSWSMCFLCAKTACLSSGSPVYVNTSYGRSKSGMSLKSSLGAGNLLWSICTASISASISSTSFCACSASSVALTIFSNARSSLPVCDRNAALVSDVPTASASSSPSRVTNR
mmetsp:Transcript_2036/g.4598  ORF Transcript_2036/g.4598 Transcript_2036/m.4598 type:complete len:343 (+) Transcript_2036:744-1772(+)